MICREVCNSFGYRDSSGDMFAYAIIPVASKFNHNCRPNVLRQQEGPNFRFVSARAIGEGEEALISYAPPDATPEERRELFSNFLFICTCDLCQS